ncbi:MAG: dienelactone hydrolase family protein, partial [bacterium]
MKIIAVLSMILLLSSVAVADVVTEFVDYAPGDAKLRGFMAWDEAVKGPRPGVLVIHDWMGEGPFDRDVSEKLARLGYVAFSADIYGVGIRPKDAKEAGAQAGIYRKDR